ncbi:L-fucose isomerase [Formosa agariphila KMM 3901]|uniref:L-fucose isomerase n=1 Tax=Formosa agariphila (strain DSM 15362 / KCTC 12365 / LMG 23005 / KMM 3901 / M-2Alg 35-1) TaxID=1347342 RepID=T2KQP3_FORAG|nr:L-fucose isomerase [Formosa agariphila]CDF80771.1 L-fucose isomerase [Formosa agariphila KMM 3901]
MSRLIGRLPKVGIRPVIDGRELGVRESLEVQTMDMAKAAAKLIEETLRFPSGEQVECVIADTTIGGVADAAACADKFRREGVEVSLTVTPCWCYGTEVMDTDPLTPKAVWGFNGTERPGAVYLAAALAGYSQKGLPAFGIYGKEVQDGGDKSIPEDVSEKILRFVKGALAVAQMKGKSYLSIGYSSMGIAGSMVDVNFLQDYLGVRAEFVESVELLRRIEHNIFDQDEYKKALAWTKENCKEGPDRNSPESQKSAEVKEKEWEKVVKMTLICKDLMNGNPKLKAMGFGEESKGRNAIMGGFQGQRQWTDYQPNADFTESILNSSFDWNGIRQAYTFATENDCLNAISMLFGHLLTNKAQLFSDVRTYWSAASVERVTGKKLTGLAAHGIIHLINSGSTTLDATAQQLDEEGNPTMKPFWDITEDDVQRCLDNTKWPPATVEYFRGGGFSSNFLTKATMPLTMCRINLIKGIGPVLQLVEGWSVELPEDIHNVLNDRTDPTWPTTWFVPRTTGKGAFKDVYTVMAKWGANHGAISHGHIGADLISLAAMLRIPVNMHNVDENDVFRPSAWAAFGEELEGADYRACDNYGPLYGFK